MKIAFTSSAWCGRLSSFLLYLAVLLAPLPFGSVGSQAISLQVGLLGVSVILASLQPKLPVQQQLFIALAVFAAVWTATAYIQTDAGVFPGFDNPVWRSASEVLGTALRPEISVVRDLPLVALGASLAAMLALASGFASSFNTMRTRRMFVWVALSGLFYAVFGIVSFAIDPSTLFGFQKEAYRTVLTATFINRNTAAVYFACCSIAWLLIVCEMLQPEASSSITLDTLLYRLIYRPRMHLLGGVLGYLLCLIAMFMTGSRAGTASGLIGSAFFVIAFFFRSISTRTSLIIFLLGLLVWVAVVMQILGAGVTDRFDIEGFSDVARLNTYRSTIQSIQEKPVFGSGLGTFEWAYPPYRSSELSVRGVWDRAHSTPLEIAADMGIPICVLALLAWSWIAYTFARAIYLNSRKAALPAAAASMFLTASLHSVIDFSLQTSGFAVTVFAVIGSGLAQSCRICSGAVVAADNRKEFVQKREFVPERDR